MGLTVVCDFLCGRHYYLSSQTILSLWSNCSQGRDLGTLYQIFDLVNVFEEAAFGNFLIKFCFQDQLSIHRFAFSLDSLVVNREVKLKTDHME